MGVLYDYFRAADHGQAREFGRRPGGPVGTADPAPFTVDGLAVKGLDPCVVMGRLLAGVLDVPWSPRLVVEVPVWPPGPVPQGPRAASDVSLCVTGPCLTELGGAFRDGLAGVDDFQLPWIADHWWRTEELRGAGDPLWALALAERFVALARRAQDANQSLYCWACL